MDATTESSGRCPQCGRRIPVPQAECPFCHPAPEELDGRTIPAAIGPDAAPPEFTRVSEPGSRGELEGRILGDFQILHTLGRGGMGTVYEAYQQSMRRKVALKVLDAGIALSEAEVTRFEREAWIGGKLNHPNIVKVLMQGKEQERHFLAMELVEGRSLHHEIQQARAEKATASQRSRAGRARIRRLVTLFIPIADGLDHVHQQGIIHRDIKPLNLLMTGDGSRLLLSDFGLARDEEASRMTRRGEFFGTVRYMSPEQLLAQRVPLDHRSDIYSLGVTLYEALTLELPFAAATEEAYLSAASSKEPIPARQRNADLPKDLETILMRCLERDRDRRYSSAGELRDDLERWLEDRPILARRPSPWVKFLRFSRRKRALLAVTAAAAVIAAGGMLLFARVSRTHRDLERVRWTLTQMLEKNVEPGRVEPDWPALREVLHQTMRTEPSGTLALLALRAAPQLRPTLPAYGLLADLPAVRIEAFGDTSFIEPVRGLLWKVSLEGSWDDAPWVPVKSGWLGWRACPLGSSFIHAGFDLRDFLQPSVLTPGPHWLNLRAHLVAWQGTQESLAVGRNEPEQKLFSVWGPQSDQIQPPDRAPLLEYQWQLETVRISLFDRVPENYPRAVASDSMPPPERWLHPTLAKIYSLRLPAGGQGKYTFHVPKTDDMYIDWPFKGSVPLGASPTAGFPACVGLDLAAPENLNPAIPMAALATLRIPGSSRPLAEFPFVITSSGNLDCWKLSGVNDDGSGHLYTLLASVEANGLLPRGTLALPAEGTYSGFLDLTPSREAARCSHLIDRYWDFGRTVSFPIQIVIASGEGKWETVDLN